MLWAPGQCKGPRQKAQALTTGGSAPVCLLRWVLMTAVRVAFDAGVWIGSGSDLLGPDQAGRGLELALKAEVLGPMRAIVSATSASARILRRPDLGTLAPGATADVIAVDFDPLDEPWRWADPERVVLVIKDGVVVKDTRKAAS